MAEVTFTVTQDVREYLTRTYEVKLNTEDYEDEDALRDAAYDAVADGDAEEVDVEYTDGDVIETNITDYDLGDVDDYDWKDPTKQPEVAVKPESSLEW